MKLSIPTTLSFVVGLALGGLGLAHAADPAPYTGSNAREVNALKASKLDLVEAIQIAERETSGEALKAEIEVKKKGTVAYFEVEVFANGAVHDVRIDANSGAVLEVKAD